MKHKRLLIAVIALLVLVGGAFIYSQRYVLFPSQQMKQLRSLEASLNLPTPKYRYEDDRGRSTDAKGAVHYYRHIALSYEDVSVLGTLQTKLLKNGWKSVPVSSASADNHFSFQKGSGDTMQCVDGYSHPKDADGITLYVSLDAAGEYACNPA